MSAAGGGVSTPLKALFTIEGVEEARKLLESLDPVLKELGSGVDDTAKRFAAMAKEITKIDGKQLTPLQQSMDKITRSEKELEAANTKTSQSFTKSKSAVDGSRDSYARYNSEGQKLTQINSNVASSMSKAGSSAEKTSQSFNATALAEGKIDSSATKAVASSNALANAQGKLQSSSQAATGGLNAETNTLTQLDTTTQRTVASTENLQSKFLGQVGSITAVSGSVVTLWQSYDSLGDAQLKVDKATNVLHATQIKIQALQQKLQKLNADGKSGTEEYALAEDKLNLAQDKLIATQGTLQNAQEDLQVTYADFYQNILPQGVTLFGSLTAVMANSKGAFTNVMEGIRGIGKEGSILNSILSKISLTNPFFIALTAGAAIVGAFATNLFGFRDAINSVGVALGNAIAPLKPFLTMIGQMGEGITDAMGQGGDATKAYADDTEGSLNSVNQALEGSGQQTQGYVSLVSQEIKNADGVVVGFTNGYAQNMQKNVSATEGFGTALGTLSQIAKTEFQKTLQEAKTAYTELQRLFDKSTTLNGITASGLPGENQPNYKLPPKSNILQDVQGGYNPPSLSQTAKDVLGKVETQFDPSSQKTLFNQKELQKAYESGKLTLKEYGGVLETLSKKYQLYGLVQDTNISGADKLKQTTDQVSGAFLQEGVSLLDLGTLADRVSKSEQARKDILDGTTTATQGGTDANKAWAVSALGAAGAQDISAQSTSSAAQATITLNEGQKKMKADNEKITKDFATYNDILNDNTLMADAAAQGTGRQIVAMKQAQVEVLGNATASMEYARQLNTLEGGQLAVADGAVAQQDSLNQAKASMLGTIGALGVLSNATTLQDAKNVALADGYVKQELALKNTQIAIQGTIGTTKAMSDEWARGESQSISFNKGMADQALSFETAKTAVFEMAGSVEEMRNEYASGEAQTLAYNQAYVQQSKTFEEDKTKADALKGTILALNEEGASGEAQQVAYANAFQEQELAFTQSKTKADALQGTIQAMQQEFDVASVIAYNNAFGEQQLKIEEDALAIEGMQGTIDALINSFKRGEQQQMAFTKGVRESELAFQNTKVANLELEGSIATLISHLTDGTQQQVSFTKGMLDTRQAVLQSVAGYSQLEGSFSEYSTAIDSGLPQSIAYKTAMLEASKAIKEMDVQTATTLGTLEKLNEQLAEGATVAAQYMTGFTEGAKSIAEWATSLDKTTGSVDGAMGELGQVADMMKIDLPEGVKMSVDEWKKYIEVMHGVGSAGDEALAGLEKIGESLESSVASAMKSGKGVKDAIKGIAEDTGLEFNKEFKNAIKVDAMATNLKDQIEKGLGELQKHALQISPETFSDVAEQINSKIVQAVALDPGLADIAGKIQTSLEKLKLNPGDTAEWKVLAANLEAFKKGGDGAGKTAGEMAQKQGQLNQVMDQSKTSLENTTGAMNTYAEAIASTQRAVQAYQQNTGGNMFANALGPNGETGFGQASKALEGTAADASTPAPTAAGPKMDFTQQITAIDALKTKLAEIPTAVGTMVAQSNQVLTQFMAPLATVTAPAVTLVEQQLLLIPTTIGTMVSQSNMVLTQFLAPLATITAPALTAVEQMLMLLPTDVGTMVTSSNQILTQFLAPLATVTGPALTLVEQMLLTIPTDVQTMVTSSNQTMTQFGAGLTTAFPKMQTDAANAFQGITNIAVSEAKKVGPSYAKAAGDVEAGLKKSQTGAANNFQAITNIAKGEANKVGPLYKTAADAVNKALDSMQQKATKVFDSIAKSADKAKKSVDALKKSIDALKDKTITITTVYKTVGTKAASGFGPSVVNHPINLTVGESGPEYVSVVPLTSEASKNLPPQERLSLYGDPGKKRKNSNVEAVHVNDSNYSNYNSPLTAGKGGPTNLVSGGGINQSSINDGFVEALKSAMQKQNLFLSNMGSGGGGITNNITNTGGAHLPPINLTSGIGGATSGVGNLNIDGLVNGIKDAIMGGFSRTSINVNSTAYIDSDKIYDKNEKTFGLKLGTNLG